MDLISKEEREKRVRELMAQCGMTREKAEFVTAVDLGEIPGDAVQVKDTEHAEPGTRD